MGKKGKSKTDQKETYVIRTVYIKDWQDKEIRRRNINFSDLVRDLLTRFLEGGDPYVVSEDIYLLSKRIEVLEQQLAEIEELSLSKLKELKEELEDIKAEMNKIQEEKEAQINQDEEIIAKIILEQFKDVNYNIDRLARKVKDLNKAIKLRLYTKVPARYGQPLTPRTINKIIKKRDELAFLRPYIVED